MYERRQGLSGDCGEDETTNVDQVDENKKVEWIGLCWLGRLAIAMDGYELPKTITGGGSSEMMQEDEKIRARR